MVNNIKGLTLVDYIGERKGSFLAIVKVQAGFPVVYDAGSELPSLNRWKKGALQSIQFQPEGSKAWLTVFARKGTKVILLDKAIAENVEVGTINQLFYNTNLMDHNQYKAVGARTWADKVFVMNYSYENQFSVLNQQAMKKVVLPGITYYEVVLGGVCYMSFNPQELIVRMAQANLSLN